MSFYLVGIDEAGYGPQLGPLVVSAVVFELPDAFLITRSPIPITDCLWERLSGTISRQKPHPDKLIVCDSKKIYQPVKGLKQLEKTALAFTRLIYSDYPDFYRDGLVLPVSVLPAEIDSLSTALKSNLSQNSMKFCEIKARIVEPSEFNAGVARCQNKADFLWEVSAQLIKYCVDKYHLSDLIIKAGKQGGRTYYELYLNKLLPARNVKTMKQQHHISAYYIPGDLAGNKPVSISFIRDGDSSEFVIALASIFSKYFRELAMFRFNSFFRSHLPALKPTSGYYNDSRQFIESITPVLDKLGLDKNNFIRNK